MERIGPQIIHKRRLAVDLVGSENLATGRIDLEQHGLDAIIVAGSFQLGLDHIDHVVSSVQQLAADDAFDLDDGHLVPSPVILDHDLLQARFTRMGHTRLKGKGVAHQQSEVGDHAHDEQH